MTEPTCNVQLVSDMTHLSAPPPRRWALTLEQGVILIFILLGVNLFIYIRAWQAQPPTALGLIGPAPAFVARTREGAVFDLAQPGGHPVMLNFIAPTDGYSLAEAPVWAAFIQAHHDIQVVWVLRVDAPDVAELQAALPSSVIWVGAPDALWDAYLVTHGTPMTYFIDAAGLIRVSRVGGPITAAQLDRYTRQIIPGELP